MQLCLFHYKGLFIQIFGKSDFKKSKHVLTIDNQYNLIHLRFSWLCKRKSMLIYTDTKAPCYFSVFCNRLSLSYQTHISNCTIYLTSSATNISFGWSLFSASFVGLAHPLIHACVYDEDFAQRKEKVEEMRLIIRRSTSI